MPHERRRAPRIEDGNFAKVIRGYLESKKFEMLAQETRRNWNRQLRLAERPDTLGAISVYAIRPALVQAFLDGLADLPGKQEVALKALKQVERWALVRDLLPHPITIGVEIVGSKGGHKPWSDQHVEIAEHHARRGFGRLVTLAANTGQRGSDLVRMRWTDIEVVQGRPGINVKQQKTGLVLWIPFTQPLVAALASWERRPGFILTQDSGLPWQRKTVSTLWAKERDGNPDLQPLAGLVFHGLRATACIRLSRAGATTRQIADWVGMSERQVGRYCRFSEQKENALAAVVHLDRYSARVQPIDKKG
jgi:integrase